MTLWKKNYHPLYQQLKSENDPYVIEWISKKEEIIVASPLSWPCLKHKFKGIHRYKGGKLRILYILSTERSDLWKMPPQIPEVLFVYFDLRKDETYDDALKLLRRHQIL